MKLETCKARVYPLSKVHNFSCENSIQNLGGAYSIAPLLPIQLSKCLFNVSPSLDAHNTLFPINPTSGKQSTQTDSNALYQRQSFQTNHLTDKRTFSNDVLLFDSIEISSITKLNNLAIKYADRI